MWKQSVFTCIKLINLVVVQVNEDPGKDLTSAQRSSSLQDRDLIEELQSQNMQNRFDF